MDIHGNVNVMHLAKLIYYDILKLDLLMNDFVFLQVARLEKSCQSLEQQLLRSNQIIQHQKNALDQHTQMVTKIHELTSNPSRTSLEDVDS